MTMLVTNTADGQLSSGTIVTWAQLTRDRAISLGLLSETRRQALSSSPLQVSLRMRFLRDSNSNSRFSNHQLRKSKKAIITISKTSRVHWCCRVS